MNHISLLTLAVTMFCCSANGQLCFSNPTDFANFCSNTYQGIVDGGRCFFVKNDTTMDWSDSWAFCKQFGGVLASVQTSREAQLILDYVENAKGIWRCRALIALRDDEWSNPPTGVTLNTTYWFNDVSARNTALVAGNTVARYHTFTEDEEANGTVPVPRCFSIAWTDDPCDNPWWFPVCQISNEVQSYAQSSQCMMETPLEIFSGSVQDCTEACSRQPSCRSFNFKGTSEPGTCELFPWSRIETCPECPVMADVLDCYHYDYVV